MPRNPGHRAAEPQDLIPLDQIPDPVGPVPFLGADEVPRLGEFVFLNWETTRGVLAVAYPTTRQSGSLPAQWVRQFKPDVRCVLVVTPQLYQAPDGPILSTDRSTGKTPMWRDYARVIGQPAPYWPDGVAQPDLIKAWRPGHAEVTAVPAMPHDMTPLIALAGRYPCESAVHRVLTCLYQWAVYNAGGPTRSARESLTDRMFLGLHGTNRLVLAAAAESIDKPVALSDLFEESAVRAVFAELLDRRDPLAELVVACLYRGNLDHYFPHARPESYVPATSPLAQQNPARVAVMVDEWLSQCGEVAGYQPDARFGYWRLMPYSGVQRIARRFVDQASGAPVVEIVDDRGTVQMYQALVPRRLPATRPLAEWIVDGGGHQCWVRTTDGVLYPAPVGNRDTCWGHDGWIAPLVERLLDDVNAEPLDSAIAPSHNELTLVSTRDVPNGTVFPRADLEQARRRPWTPRA